MLAAAAVRDISERKRTERELQTAKRSEEKHEYPRTHGLGNCKKGT
jgi:hypothetical protein